jgi:nucleoporin POM152
VQPERSGHYIFTFVRMNDANYRRVDLQGPTIEQIIHPLASADFADSSPGNRGRTVISSCSGSTIDVDVNLRVSSLLIS